METPVHIDFQGMEPKEKRTQPSRAYRARSPRSIIDGLVFSECPLFFATFLTRVRHPNLALSR